MTDISDRGEVRFYCEGWPLSAAGAALQGIAQKFPKSTVRNERGYYVITLGDEVDLDYPYITDSTIVEGDVSEIDVEDSGQAKIAQINDEGETGLFVRVQSWQDHQDFDRLIQTGERYRVTIERLT